MRGSEGDDSGWVLARFEIGGPDRPRALAAMCLPARRARGTPVWRCTVVALVSAIARVVGNTAQWRRARHQSTRAAQYVPAILDAEKKETKLPICPTYNCALRAQYGRS